MTDFEAYQEYIQRKHNAFCKAVIRYAARDKILQLRRKWERQISLDYLMDEKFVQFAGPEPDEEYPFTVCGQTVLLCNETLVLCQDNGHIKPLFFSKISKMHKLVAFIPRFA